MKQFKIAAEFVVNADKKEDAEDWFDENVNNFMEGDGVLYGTSKIEQVEPPVTKQTIYDEMCRVLTDYEEGRHNELYDMLVKIQNNWECVITAQR